MRKLHKKCSMVLLAGMLALTFVGGCQKQPVSSKNRDHVNDTQKVLSYSVLSSIDQLDAQKMNQLDASTIGYHIYEGLVRNENGTIVPAGAESYTVSEDGRTYRFRIRKARWSDGTRITAEDYAAGIRRLMDESTGCDYRFLGYCIRNGAAVGEGALPPEKLGVKALNDEELMISLERETGSFLEILSMVQFSPVPAEKAEGPIGDSPENVSANGPFRISDWTRERIELVKNEEYWNSERIRLDKVVITKRNSIREVQEAYEKGEDNLLTQTYLPTGQDDFTLYHDGQFVMVRLNMENRILSDRNFRKALLYSIDQRKLCETVFEGVPVPAEGFLLHDDDGTDEFHTYHPKEAKKAIRKAEKESGWGKKKPLKLTLTCSDMENRRQIAVFLKESWEKTLGIEVKIRQLSSQEKLQHEAAGDFDLILTKWVPDYEDPIAYLENWYSGSPYNQGGFKNKKFDKKLEKAQKSRGETREKLLTDAELILKEEIPALPLYFRRKVLLTKEGVTGISTNYAGYQYNYMDCRVD